MAVVPNRERTIGALAAGLALALLASCAPASRDAGEEAWPPQLDDRSFRAMVTDFSEPPASFTSVGGYRSDNLVSNERSLFEVMPTLLRARRSGAYLGVGPEQNFSYIVALEPSIAFVIDIRRENLLLHLLYKALAEESSDRVSFLSRLFARQPPSGLEPGATVEAMLMAFQRRPRSDTLAQATVKEVIGRLEGVHDFSLTPTDRSVIGSLLHRFGEEGPAVRWDPTGGTWIPSYAELMAATDPQGVQRSYLATEDAFQVFRRYQLRNRIVPLVGDFGGTTTLPAVARYLRSQQTVVAAFYLSNVKGYLRGEAVARFSANVAALPRDGNSVLVQTIFGQVGYTNGRPDFSTRTLTQPMHAYVDARRDPAAARDGDASEPPAVQ